MIKKGKELIPRKLSEYLKEEGILKENQKITSNIWDNKIFKDYCIENRHRIYRAVNSISPDLREESLKNKDIIISRETNGGIVYALNGKRLSTLDKTMKLISGEYKLVQLLGDLWTDIDFQNTQNQGGVSFTNAKKPEQLILRIINMVTDEGDIVLDFHLGSGTTAAVAHKMNRQYIGIEQMDYIENITVERMKKVIDGEQGGISKDVNWQGGGVFVYCELKNDAEEFKNSVIESKSTEKLIKLLNFAKKSSFLSYRINPKKLKEKEFLELSFPEQKQLLLEIIDKNNLYVNFSDINDEIYKIPEIEKKLNIEFYGGE